jgi:hypothetical protein
MNHCSEILANAKIFSAIHDIFNKLKNGLSIESIKEIPNVTNVMLTEHDSSHFLGH